MPLTLPVVSVLVRVLVVAELELVPTSGFLSSSVDPILVVCVDVTLALKKQHCPLTLTAEIFYYRQHMIKLPILHGLGEVTFL